MSLKSKRIASRRKPEEISCNFDVDSRRVLTILVTPPWPRCLTLNC